MALYIKDPIVESLLDQIMKQGGVKTKVDAVRIALQHEVERISRNTPLRDKFAAIRDKRSDLLGRPIAGVDQKKLMDNLWENGE